MPLEKSKNNHQLGLLSYTEIPRIMRIPFILHGYRRLYQPWMFYLRSLFTLHNESINVWSHLVGALLILFEAFSIKENFENVWPMEIQLVMIFATCSVLMHLASTMTHLVHSRSCTVHMFTFFCDYFGIGIAGLGVSLCVFCFCTLPDYAAALLPYFLPLSGANAVIMSVVFCYIFGTRRRRYTVMIRIAMFLPIGTYYLWTFGTFFYKLYLRYKLNQPSLEIQWNHMGHLLLLVGSFAFYITRLPERLKPGAFDICGQSHQIFHCGVSLSQWGVLKAIHGDLKHDSPLLYSKQFRPLSISSIWTTWCIVIALNLFFLALLYRLFCHDEKSYVDEKDE